MKYFISASILILGVAAFLFFSQDPDEKKTEIQPTGGNLIFDNSEEDMDASKTDKSSTELSKIKAPKESDPVLSDVAPLFSEGEYEQLQDNLKTHAGLIVKGLMSEQEKELYEELLSSEENLKSLGKFLSLGELHEDSLQDLESVGAKLTTFYTDKDVSEGQTSRIRAVEMIKQSYPRQKGRVDFEEFGRNVLFSPNLKGDIPRDTKYAIIASKIELYDFFKGKIENFDDYLQRNSMTPYEQKLHNFLKSGSS